MLISKLPDVMQDKPLTARSIHALSRTTESLATVVRLLNDLADSGQIQRRYQQGRWWYGKSPKVFGERSLVATPKQKQCRLSPAPGSEVIERQEIIAYLRIMGPSKMPQIYDAFCIILPEQRRLVRKRVDSAIRSGIVVRSGDPGELVYSVAETCA